MKTSALLACSALLIGATLPGQAVAGELEPSTVTVGTPTTADATPGTPVTVSGTVTGDADGRRVRLQLDTPNGWMPVGAPGTTDAEGAFTLPVPTDWYYDGALRVSAPRTDTHAAAQSAGFAMRVHPAYAPTGDTSDWRTWDDRARWNPCATLTYKVNTKGGPDGAKKLVKQAVRRLHEASGVLFEYRGTTRAIPFREGPGKAFSNAEVTIAWATRKQVPLLSNGTIGWGGVWWNNRFVNYRGGIALLRSANVTSEEGPGGTWQNLVLHELGHVLGLDHAETTEQVMYPQIPYSPGRFEAGDLAGLTHLGATQGCYRGVSSRTGGTPGFASAP